MKYLMKKNYNVYLVKKKENAVSLPLCAIVLSYYLLKATLNVKDNLIISKYSELIAFLKK